MNGQSPASEKVDAILGLIDEALGDSHAGFSADGVVAVPADISHEEFFEAIIELVDQAEAEEESDRVESSAAIGKLSVERRWGWPSRSR